MSYTVAVIDNKLIWENFVRNHPFGHFLQGWNWGEFKSPDWRPIRLGLYNEDQLVATAQILTRNFFSRKLFYIPRGPVVDPKNKKVFAAIFAGIKNKAREESAFAIYLEPNFTEAEAKGLLTKDFLAAAPTQPADTSIIDLTIPKEQILDQMSSKTRQYIRKATREGVTFWEDREGKNIKEFIKVIESIRGRSKILLHPTSYYQRFWELFKGEGGARLFFVSLKNVIEGGYLVVGYGQTAYELYGGTKELQSATKARYLLKSGSIETFKESGYKLYDQMGIAPTGDTKHHYSGVTIFKERFGGHRVTYVGSFHFVLSNPWHLLWQVSLRVRPSLIKVGRTLRKWQA